MAIKFSSTAHSNFGRPRLRTYLCVAGSRDPRQNAQSRKREPVLAVAAFPKSNSCCRSSMCVAETCRVSCRTVELLTREMNDGWMPQIVLRHRFWKPSTRRRWAAFSHPVARPYCSLLMTVALKMSIFLRRVSVECFQTLARALKSDLALPIRLTSSWSIDPSFDTLAPK